MALDGCTALVGAPSEIDAGTHFGAAYVFVRSGEGWIRQQKLTVADRKPYHQFGFSVALQGDTALVAAIADPGAGGANSQSGAVYVFARSGVTWTQQAKLAAGDGTFGDWFGYSLALDGDRALIGAFGDDDAGPDSGSAYIFGPS